MQIKILKNEYDRVEFYSLMGKFFAEKKYKKELPYLINKDTDIWFLVFNKNILIAFAAINELKRKLIFEHLYIEEKFRDKDIWKMLNEKRLE